MYKISIILPLFNVEKYVKKSFNSILNQTIGFENLEVIYVDDCSTDSSASIVQDFADKYENVKYFSLEENSGAAGKPRNVGIENASADYIMFLDPDDRFFEDACEKLYNRITGDDADVVCGNYVRIQGKETIKNKWGSLKLKNGEIRFDSIEDNPNILKNHPAVWTKIFKKDLIMENNIRFPEGVPAQDFYFVCNYFSNANGILYIKDYIAKHRHDPRGESIRSKKDKKTLSGLIKAYNDTYQLLKEEYESLKWVAAFNLYSWSKTIVFSDLDAGDKMDLLYQAKDLYLEVKDSPNLHYKKGYESFYEKVCEKDYYGAIKAAENIRLADSIKSRNVFMTFVGFGLTVSTTVKAVFNRANLLSKNGYKNITLLNIDTFKNENIFEDFKNFKYRESLFKDKGHLNKSIRIINMFDYFSVKNTVNFAEKYYSTDYLKIAENLSGKIDLLDAKLKLKDRFFIHDRYIIERRVTKDEQVIFRYYEKVQIRQEITSLYNLGKLVFIKNFSVPKDITPIKSETYINNSLVVETFYGDELVKLYTPDGFNYCSITPVDGELLFYLNDRNSSSPYTMSHKEFYEHFIMKICLESSQKPFLINDCSGKKPSIADIPSELTYKISNIHCNHHENPFGYGSEIKTLGALENLGDLDELVFLSESQQNDFEKEFHYERVHNIPYFLPDDALKRTHFDKSEVKNNKISVFSKMEPGKNIGDIIQAFKNVVEAKPDATLEIYGKNLKTKEHKRLMKLVEECNIQGNVTFRDDYFDKYREMADSLATVITSKSEGLDPVLLESMANGTPVISYDTNYGPSDIIEDDVDGCIVPAGNISQLSEKMLNLLNDPVTAIEMGQTARKKIIKNYSEKKAFERWDDLLKQAVLDNENNRTDCNKHKSMEKVIIDEALIERNTLLTEENSRLNLNLKSLESEIIRLNRELDTLKNKKPTLKEALKSFR